MESIATAAESDKFGKRTEFAIVVFRSCDVSLRPVTERCYWTSEISAFKEWIGSLKGDSGHVCSAGDVALAYGLLEALYLF